MKTTAKVLSVVLALVLLVCAFTLVISADDTVVDSGTVYNETADATYTGENCITSAFNDATLESTFPETFNQHNVIKLMSDVTVTGDYMFVRGDVTLDLNGYTLKLVGTTEYSRSTFYCNTPGTTFTVTGEGKIITSDRSFFNEAINESADITDYFDFKIIGTGNGIDIEFDSTTNGTFATYNAGNVYLENVDIKYKGYPNNNAFNVSGNYAPTLTFKNVTFEALENANKIRDNIYTNATTQGDKPIFNLNGNCYVKIENSSVRSANNGAMFNLNGTTVGRTSDGVALDAKNSYFDCSYRFNAGGTIFGGWKQQYSGTYNFDNCEIVYAQRFDATNYSSTATPPTFNIHDTRITKIAGWYDQTKDFSSYDSANFPGRTFNFTGNSALITDFKVASGTAYGGNIGIGAWVKLDEGTRVASPSGVASATLAEGCQLYFDPAGDPTAPWIVAKEAPATADAAAEVYYANMSYNFWGESSFGTGSNFTHRTVNSDGNTVTVEGTAPGATPYADGESAIKHGTVNTEKVGGNTAYKYTVIAPDNQPDATMFPGGTDTDAYTITGKPFNLTSYPQVVIDADIMANENGFANLTISFQVRGQSNSNRAGGTDAGIRVSNDGTVAYTGSTGNKISQAENMPKLSLTDWNHITIVCDAKENTATFYVNGEFAIEGKLINKHTEYLAGTETGLYCQGFRISTATSSHKVGSGYLLDNVMQRGYTDSGAAYTQIGTASDIVANENIRVNGKPYQTVDAALKAAALAETDVQLYGNVAAPQTVTTDGKVVLNDYDFDYTAESYPVNRATDSYTFDSTNTKTVTVTTYLNYEYTDIKVDEVKLGHKIPAYDAAEDFESPVAYASFTGDWDGPVDEYATAAMISVGEQEIYPIYETSLKTNKELGIKTNLSLYSDFVVNIYVPAALVDGGYVTLTDESFGTYEIGGVTYYAYAKSVNYAGVATATSFDIAIADTKDGVLNDDFDPLTGERTVDVSVLGYAKAILANEAYAADHALMNAMLNYVYEAAVYFENDVLAAALEEYNAEENNQTYEAVTENNTSVIKSVSVDINADAPAFVITFNDTYTGKVTVTYKNVYGTEKTEVVEANGTEVAIATLRVYNLDATLTITLEGEDGEFNYNLDAYAQYLEGDAAETLVKALYDYIATAKAYKLA